MKTHFLIRLVLFVFFTLSLAVQAGEAVNYEDFGAKGDGQTDDFAAIVAAHKHANEQQVPVKVKRGAVYYMGGENLTVPIETSTDFGDARFIIDDTEVQNRGSSVFVVQSTLKPINGLQLDSLKKNQKRVKLKLDSDAIITVVNKDSTHYVRRGANANAGDAQIDSFLVNARGMVHPETPIIWDFESISKLTVRPIDKKALTLKGGHFTTLANQEEGQHKYYKRGFSITRSRVVIDGMVHEIKGEGEHSYPYLGFLNINHCAYVTVKNSQFSGHKSYDNINGAGNKVRTGTYDLMLSHALFVDFINCGQLNSIHDGKYWGIMASNYCKNLRYENCKLSRFDAHRGVTNASISHSEIGHAGINLIGGGLFVLEKSTVHSGRIIGLRNDYGSSWDGDIIIKDCIWPIAQRGKGPFSIIIGNNDGQHLFGYPCSMPQKVLIQNLEIRDNPQNKTAKIYLFSDMNRHYKSQDYKERYPYALTEEISLRKIDTASGQEVEISPNAFLNERIKKKGKVRIAP